MRTSSHSGTGVAPSATWIQLAYALFNRHRSRQSGSSTRNQPDYGGCDALAIHPCATLRERGPSRARRLLSTWRRHAKVRHSGTAASSRLRKFRLKRATSGTPKFTSGGVDEAEPADCRSMAGAPGKSFRKGAWELSHRTGVSSSLKGARATVEEEKRYPACRFREQGGN